MTIEELIKIEDNAKEVWVVSPNLHYDTENKDFAELVSVNLGEKTKYKYIVPATKQIRKNIKIYKNLYHLTSKDIKRNFLFLPRSEFNPFILECAIYDANTDCIACAAPAIENAVDVIRFQDGTAKKMAKQFRSIWKKYKREDLRPTIETP